MKNRRLASPVNPFDGLVDPEIVEVVAGIGAPGGFGGFRFGLQPGGHPVDGLGVDGELRLKMVHHGDRFIGQVGPDLVVVLANHSIAQPGCQGQERQQDENRENRAQQRADESVVGGRH
ncbi:MAG: hypothetical protein SV598_07635 [Pseudomonadota bacterium]|nr:hypothetical protein [Pseudomonadota bacterium]